MTKKEALELVRISKPERILVSGRSAVGKSTFSNELTAFDYVVIRSDDIVKKELIPELNIDFFEAFKVYRGTAPQEWQKSFISKIHSYMDKNLTVLDSSISNREVLHEIFSDTYQSFLFLYLHPLVINNYLERIKKRFASDIALNEKTLPLWHTEAGICDEITPELVAAYKKDGYRNKDINGYLMTLAKNLIKASAERLEKFRKDGFDVKEVDV